MGCKHTQCADLVLASVAWIALAHGAMRGIALRFVAHNGWKEKVLRCSLKCCISSKELHLCAESHQNIKVSSTNQLSYNSDRHKTANDFLKSRKYFNISCIKFRFYIISRVLTA